MRSPFPIVAVFLAGMLASCAPTVTTITAPPAAVAPVVEARRAADPVIPETLERVILGSFKAASCDFADLDGVEIEPECGWLTTPMLGTDSPIDIELPVVIFRATGPDPAPDPIVYLHGGPAGALVEYAGLQYETIVAPFVSERDVVLFDQRGSGLAEPSLICEPANNFWSDPSQDDDVEYIERRARTCAWRLRNDDIVLTEFNKLRSADDVMVLARELGYEQINLIGTSWGGLLATTVMTEHPDLVRSALLNSPLSYQTDLSGSMPASYLEAITALQAECDRVPACVDRNGDIAERLDTLAASLDANPLQLTLLGEPYFSEDQYEFAVELTGEELVHLVFGLLYSPDAIASIPDLLLDLEAGDTRLVNRFSSIYGWGWGFDFGFLTYMCTDVVPASSPEAVAALQTGVAVFDRIDDVPDGRGHTAPILCKAMNVAAAGTESATAPPTAPTLVFSGRLDPITAYSTGESLAEALPTGHFVGFDGLSHGALQDWCASFIAVEFFASPEQPLDTGCVEGRPPLEIADAALSQHQPNTLTTTVLETVVIDGESVSVEVLEGYRRDQSDSGTLWWRDDAPYDLTGFAVLVSNGDTTAAQHVEERFADLAAFEIVDESPVAFGGSEWTRREVLSPFGVALVSLVRSDGELALLLQAYPEELAALEPYMTLGLSSS